MAEKKILLKQTGSTIRRDKRQLRTLQALGLGRIGKSAEHTATPTVLGMAKAVSHLITVEELSGK